MDIDFKPLLTEAQTLAAQVTQTITQLETENANLQAQLEAKEALEDSFETLSGQFAAAQAELETIKAHLADRPDDTRVPELEGRVASLTSELSDVTAQRDRAWDRTKKREAERDAALEQVSVFTKQEGEYQTEVAGLRAELDALKKKVG